MGRFHDASQRELFPVEFQRFFPVEEDVRFGEVRLSQALFTWGQVGAAIRAAREGVAFAEDSFKPSGRPWRATSPWPSSTCSWPRS